MVKVIAFFISLFIAIYGNSQDTAYKRYSDSTGAYLIEYRHSGFGFRPLTYPPGEPHYYSTITVFSIPDTVIVGKPFQGVYVKDGCFEDEPEIWVRVAKQLQEAKKENSKD